MAIKTLTDVRATPLGVLETEAAQSLPLGTVLLLGDGREFVYCWNAAVALLPGRLIQSAAGTSDHLDMVTDTVASGETVVTPTLGATAVTLNEFAEGTLIVSNNTGDIGLTGNQYLIASHPAASGTATCAVTLSEALVQGIVDADQTTLVLNKYAEVIIHPGPPTSSLIGVPLLDITASHYFWCLTKGICGILTEGTLVTGNPVVNGDNTPGAVSPWVDADLQIDEQVVGRCILYNAGDISIISLEL